MTLSRLDRANYGGSLVQAHLFKELRTPQDDWTDYEVDPNEEYDLYKISYRFYGTIEAWWVIAVIAKLDNPLDRLEAGTVLKLPPLSWVRDKLKNPPKTVTV
jgi:hypothetical protein